jgi:transcriptional regulator GlxA family with amidase domain
MVRELTGDSFVEYQSRQRVLHGATLLSLPGTTVVTAAAVVGVESPSYLARLFTRDGSRCREPSSVEQHRFHLTVPQCQYASG